MAKLLTSALLLLLGVVVQGADVYRHSFLFKLYGASPANLTAVMKFLKDLPDQAAPSGKPVVNVYGQDLGISKNLYATPITSTAWQADVGGYLEFDSEDKLRGYFKWLVASPSFAPFGAYLATPSRMQYITATAGTPTKGVIRHQFTYRWDNVTAGGKSIYPSYNTVQAAKLYLTKAIKQAPVKPTYYVFESDLGITKQLSSSPVPGYNFGGVLDFKTEADAAAWFKYLLSQPEYKAMVSTTSAAARIQYKY